MTTKLYLNLGLFVVLCIGIVFNLRLLVGTPSKNRKLSQPSSTRIAETQTRQEKSTFRIIAFLVFVLAVLIMAYTVNR